MARPDRMEAKEGVTRPDQTSPRTSDLTDGTAFSDLKSLTAVNCNIMILAGEAEKRAGLLLTVLVDSNGVARCVDSNSGAETLLAAVIIDSKKTAILTPLESGSNRVLHLPVPANTPTRFGFFVGHLGEQPVSMAFRMGLYPGLPLVTETRGDKQNREVYVGVRGIKPDEADEQSWSQQIEAFMRLGFIPTKTRGVFNRFHRPNPGTDDWKSYPLVALPDQMLDRLNNYDPTRVQINKFQMLYYATRDVVSRPISFPLAGLREYFGCGEFQFGTGGIGVGFGEAVSTQYQVTGMTIDFLIGAFEVVVTPK